jgi:adenylosuccinate synthase
MSKQMQLPLESVIVVGGQFGSEGKGAVIHEIGDSFGVHVRTGGVQAGHSIKFPEGHKLAGEIWKLQTIPVGAALGKTTVIAMASVIDPEILDRELGWFEKAGIKLDLHIDQRATILLPEYREDEANADLTKRLGSTGKGVGAARVARLMRTAQTADDYYKDDEQIAPMLCNTSDLLRSELDFGTRVLVEAAQGIGLSLFSGGYYPFCTSAEATPTGSFADLGLPLRYAHYFASVGVFRTVPIRVAGNSGELPFEIDWQTLESRRGKPIAESEKQTTVTKKIRRVAMWDAEEARRSVVEAGIDYAFLTFVDYIYPEIEGATDWHDLPAHVRHYVGEREKELGVEIVAIGTSFGSYAWRR